MEESERIFTQMIRCIQRSRSEVTQLIRDQEKSALSQAEGLLERLEQEIAELRRRDADLEQLLNTDNHIHFLQVTARDYLNVFIPLYTYTIIEYRRCSSKTAHVQICCFSGNGTFT